MGRWRMTRDVVAFAAVTLILVALSPVVIVAGEWVNRHCAARHGQRFRREVARMRASRQEPMPVMRSPGTRQAPGTVPAGILTVSHRAGWARRWLLGNPVWIALTAPGRWAADRFRPRAGRSGRGGWPWPPSAGDREPRRPGPDLPAGSVALPEPRFP